MPHSQQSPETSAQWMLLDRYYSGDCTAVEAAEVEAWLASHSELRDVPTTLRRTYDTATVPDRAPGWHKIEQRLHGATQVAPRPRPRRVARPVWYAAAAMIVGVVGLAMGWYAKPTKPNVWGRGAVATYTTANGQRAKITLPDGSTATLNVASRLDVPADYTSGNRALRLVGEAMFTVRHHDGQPFTVATGATVTRVLGTSFTVRHYATDTSTIVAVRDGKVAVRSVVVAAAEQAEVMPSGAIRTGRANAARFGFTHDVLALRDVPIATAIADLNRWYDADIRLGDAAVAGLRLDGEFSPGSLLDLTEVLQMTFDVRVVRDGRVLTLYSR